MRQENRTCNSEEISINKTKPRNRDDGKQGHKNIYYKYFMSKKVKENMTMMRREREDVKAI